MKKVPSPSRMFFEQKSPYSLFVQIRSSKRCTKRFLHLVSPDIKLFLIFRFRKIFFYIKIISIKREQQNNPEISHNVSETTISQIISLKFCKIGLRPGGLKSKHYE